MKNCVYVMFVMALMLFLTACNSVKMKAVSDSPHCNPDVEHAYSAKAHSSFYNLENDNLQKSPQNVKIKEREFRVRNGADYVGSKNASVTYHITYWDSILAVFSFGLYVPISIEYIPNKQ